MEAEYVALSETCQEISWLKSLLKDLGEKVLTANVYEDNQSCISFAETGRRTKRSKHIDTREFFIRDLCNNGEINLKYCPTDKMKADLLTKPLGEIKHRKLAMELNLTID